MPPKCQHWRDVGMRTAGFCELHRKTWAFDVCERCPDSTEINWVQAFLRTHRPGSAIARVTTAMGITPCEGCKRRRDALDGLVRPVEGDS